MNAEPPVTAPPKDWQAPQRPSATPEAVQARMAAERLRRDAPACFTAPVRGVTFARYPDAILELDATPGIGLALRRDPDNPHDANAVAVERADTGEHLGHLPRAVAAKVAGALDAGVDYEIIDWQVLVSWQGGANQPGLEVTVARADPSP